MKRLGYETLGFLVWKGGKLYLRRKARGTATRAATGALAMGTGAAVVLLVARRSSR